MAPVEFYLIIASILFTLGVVGVVIRRNAIVVFMCIEMMLNAVNLTFVSFSRLVGSIEGQISVLFIMVVAAVESAVALAIVLALFREKKSIETTDACDLKF